MKFTTQLLISSLQTIVLLCATSYSAVAQTEIPIGTWRSHLSYNKINTVALSPSKVFAAGEHGVMILERGDNSINTYSKINGLNGTTITFTAYDNLSHHLIIAYADGKFDVATEGGEIFAFDPAKNSSVTGLKAINHILIKNTMAYLSADYGVVVFDISKMLVKETWRDLGITGGTLKIYQAAILNDSIFLATETGSLASNLNSNLQDFNKWKRFEDGDFNGAVRYICTFNNKVYCGINAQGIYHYDAAVWTKDTFLNGDSFRSMSASPENLLITGQTSISKLSVTNAISQFEDDLISRPLFAIEDSNGILWAGDERNGLVTNASGALAVIIPNCPSTDRVFDLAYRQNKIHAAAGGYSSARTALKNPGLLDTFTNGLWSTEQSSMEDLTAITFEQTSGIKHLGSFGYGVEVTDVQGNSAVYDESNSPLYNSNPPERFVNITALGSSESGMWVANYDSPQPLHLLKKDNNWESFSFPFAGSNYPLKLQIDFLGNVWLALDAAHGGGMIVFNREDNTSAYLTDVTGGGGLPSKNVNAITVDKEGSVWVGTDLGVAYFNDPGSVFSGNVNAIKPIFDNRFLLRDDKVTSIAVDGGNRKWIGTERGLWLFNDSGEELIYNFNTNNSPLLSDFIVDIEINGETGEVFFATKEGLLSFRSDATDSKTTFGSVKVFPNPVTPNFVGSIGITGLATDAWLKVTDINGKLIWQTRSNGGSASWNAKDVNGARPTTGIYIVFAVTDDGRERAVAKIAFVD